MNDQVQIPYEGWTLFCKNKGMSFTMKPFKTYGEQLKILESRGLLLDDPYTASSILQRENNYQLINVYKDLFSWPTGLNESAERFKSNTSFEEIDNLYTFDRHLRSIPLPHLLKFWNTCPINDCLPIFTTKP